jgi:hypothetical protein
VALVVALGLAPTSKRRDPRLRVEISGCAAVREDSTCELQGEKGKLRLWVEASERADVQARLDGVSVPAARKPVAGGALLEVEWKKGARSLEIRASEGERRSLATVVLAQPAQDPELDALEKRRQSSADLSEDASSSAAQRLSEPLRARALDVFARRELARGRNIEALSLLSEARALHRKWGSLSGQVKDSFVMAYTQTLLTRDFAGAARDLETARVLSERYAEGRADLSYYEGVLASETGDYRAAHAAFLDAEARSRRLGRSDQVALVQRARALLLARLGRLEEARAVLADARSSLAPEATACQRAHVLTNVGWVALRSAQRRAESVGSSSAPGPALGSLEAEAQTALAQAVLLYGNQCPNPAYLDNARVNLAELALLRGDRAAAREQLRARSPLDTDARSAASWENLEGRMKLAEGDPRAALARFDREAELGASAVLPAASLRAALGRAEAFEALGRDDLAIEQYAASEALLEHQGASLPLGQGRESYLSEHAPGARYYVDALLRTGNAKRAFEAARRARVRALAALRWAEGAATLDPAERARWQVALGEYARRRAEFDALAARDWQLSSEHLTRVRAERAAAQQALDSALGRALGSLGARSIPPSPIPAGEIALLVFPRRRGYVVFAADSHAVGVRMLNEWPEERELGAVLLGSVAGHLDRARYLRVLPYGPLKGVDVHALLVNGAPIGRRIPVVYGVDVAAPGASEPLGDRALVVADTEGDLQSARFEARRVAAQAGALGLRHQVLIGEEASRTNVLSALPRARLFHFAGHAQYASDGWSSALALASGARLTVTDVLSLRHAPEIVVLAGCETARTDSELDVASIGIAEAFVLAGARYVIAAARRPADAHARQVAEAFYSDSRALDDAPGALARAQARFVDENASLDWASFRVIVP